MPQNSKPVRSNLSGLIGIVVLGVLVWLIVASMEQNERDYRLSEAVSRRNYAAVASLLRAGASPDAPWSGYTARDFFGRILYRLSPYKPHDSLYATLDDYTILDWASRDPEDRPLMPLLLAHHHR